MTSNGMFMPLVSQVTDVPGLAAPSGVAPASQYRAPLHQVRLPGGGWVLWRSMVLRGAGFPAQMVDLGAGTAAGAAADQFEAAVDELRRCRDAARDALLGASASATPEALGRIRRLRRKIQRGVVPADAPEAELQPLLRAARARDEAYARLRAEGEADGQAAERALRTVLESPLFQEAVLWQNRPALAVALRRVRDGVGSPAERRAAFEFVAIHLQRYAAKNDSIGFFGPVGWAWFVDEAAPVTVSPHEQLVTHRDVYFEGWCIDTLADTLDRIPGIRAWTSPRLRGGVWPDGDGVVLPLRGRLQLSPAEYDVTRLCDGKRPAREIAELLACGKSTTEAEQRTFAILDQLVAKEVLVWRLEVAPQLRPELDLECRLRGIGDASLRATCLEALAALTAGRDRVADAAGQPAALLGHLDALDQTFTRLTGRSPSRKAGKMYAARGLVYEDCRRGCDVTFGTAFLDELGPPLSIVMDSGRWMAADFAAAARGYLRQRFAEIQPPAGQPIEAHRFFTYLRSAGQAALDQLAAGTVARYQAAWQSVLQLQPGDLRRRYPVDAVATRAGAAFATTDACWTRAQYMSPDVMVAAASVEAFRRGEFHGVLGELHGTNSLIRSAFLSRHPEPEWIAQALACDTSHQTIALTQQPKDEWLARVSALTLPAFWRYEYGEDLPALPPCRSVPAGMLVAVDDGRTIVLRARDGSIQFDALELFGLPLCEQLHDMIARRLPDAPHTPRVTIGNLTVARETWNVVPADMAFLALSDPHEQFAAVRRWMRVRGMPRRVFYKSPIEDKPLFLDADARVYVDIFVRLMCRVPPDATVRVSEMLPDLEETWLPDAGGRRYTCELRIAARYDPHGMQPRSL